MSEPLLSLSTLVCEYRSSTWNGSVSIPKPPAIYAFPSGEEPFTSSSVLKTDPPFKTIYGSKNIGRRFNLASKYTGTVEISESPTLPL